MNHGRQVTNMAYSSKYTGNQMSPERQAMFAQVADWTNKERVAKHVVKGRAFKKSSPLSASAKAQQAWRETEGSGKTGRFRKAPLPKNDFDGITNAQRNEQATLMNDRLRSQNESINIANAQQKQDNFMKPLSKEKEKIKNSLKSVMAFRNNVNSENYGSYTDWTSETAGIPKDMWMPEKDFQKMSTIRQQKYLSGFGGNSSNAKINKIYKAQQAQQAKDIKARQIASKEMYNINNQTISKFNKEFGESSNIDIPISRMVERNKAMQSTKEYKDNLRERTKKPTLSQYIKLYKNKYTPEQIKQAYNKRFLSGR